LISTEIKSVELVK